METGRSTLLVDLGDQMRVVEERVKDGSYADGSYASADEVIRAALQRFDDDESAEDARLTELAEEILADPGPSIPAEQVFRDLREKYGRPELIGGN